MKSTQTKPKRIYRDLSGVLLLNKPAGLSSNAALQRARHLFEAKKAGHTGALDPMATGLLPLCFGEATKFSHYLLDADKYYRAELTLGASTTTGDAEGKVTAHAPIPTLDSAVIQTHMGQFLGSSEQIPPMYSALKHHGKPLYALAREGIEIERSARTITIKSFELVNYSTHTLTFDVACSKGTYIRTLAEDLAKSLGTLGHLTALHRTRSGHFSLEPHITLPYLENLSSTQRDALLLPCYAPVHDFPQIQLNTDTAVRFRHGQTVILETLPHDHPAEATSLVCLVFCQDLFLGLANLSPKGLLQPQRIVNLPASE